MGADRGRRQPKRPEGVQLRARRNPRLIALGILFVVLGALAAGTLYSMNVTTTSVLVMARDVVRGEQIAAGDLAVLQLPQSSSVDAVSADALDDLVGSTALTDLPAGAFPALHHLGERPLPDGHSLVGLRLDTGRIPVTPLVPGTQVRLVSLAEDSDLTIDAVLATTPRREEHGSHFLLDVVIKEDEAPMVSVLAATNLLALIAEGDI